MNYFIFIFLQLLSFLNLSVFCYELCTYGAYDRYQKLITQYPDHKDKFTILSKIPLPIWVTDRDPNAFNNVKTALEKCENLINILIVYALPNKDCKSGFSSSGSNKNNQDYQSYINKLKTIVDNKEVIYIIEPDAIGLSIDHQCGQDYPGNIKNAINILSENTNAKIYLDIGYWSLIYNEDQIKKVINLIDQIDPNQKINGITLNLSNYRSNNEMIFACNRFKQMSGKKYNCIIDTSRNWNGPSSDNQWCNLITAGIGELPIKNPAESIDYYLWLKPQYELDGPCIGFSNSYQINKNAGDFDLTYLVKLWNNGNSILKKCN